MGSVVSDDGALRASWRICDAVGNSETAVDTRQDGRASDGGYSNSVTFSIANSFRFQFRPAEKPPSCCFAASTRWQGTKIGIGFAPHAPPTARTALGLRIASATCP